MTFSELFSQKRADNNWTSRETAEHYARLLDRSVPTIYRYIDGKCPRTVLELAKLKDRPKLADMMSDILK